MTAWLKDFLPKCFREDREVLQCDKLSEDQGRQVKVFPFKNCGKQPKDLTSP